MKNTFGLLLKDKYGNRITLWQAKSGQIFIGFKRDWQEFRLVFSVADELPKRYLTTYLPFAKM